MSLWNNPVLRELFFNSTPIIDVRAPVEYAEGSLPFSVNLPLMNDEERTMVGTRYKEKGQSAALELGHSLVHGTLKEQRVKAWRDYLQAHPAAQVYCFRGGLRSHISCEWLKEVGIERTPIEGGYKNMRRFFLSQLEEAPLPKLLRIGGLTGSGKTIALNKSENAIDLEGLASHRGSAFGANGVQSSQIRFENELSLELMKNETFAVVEDESSGIGRLSIPKRFFLHMRNSPLVILKTPQEERIKNIYQEYVKTADVTTFHNSLKRIAKSLGGLRFKIIEEEMLSAFGKEKTIENHEGWISALLENYYDPLYARDIKRQSELVLFEGYESEVLEYVRQYR